MLEVTGNIWDYEADAVCVTTNLVVTGNGLVMGAGIAKQAKDRYPSLPHLFGEYYRGFSLSGIRNDFTYCVAKSVIPPPNWPLFTRHIVAFPTKYHWRDHSDLLLIRKSAQDLVYLVERLEDDLDKDVTVVLPRPGCGLGGLKWDRVKVVIEPILADDRFRIITPN